VWSARIRAVGLEHGVDARVADDGLALILDHGLAIS
jgi:hypothetical protein